MQGRRREKIGGAKEEGKRRGVAGSIGGRQKRGGVEEDDKRELQEEGEREREGRRRRRVNKDGKWNRAWRRDEGGSGLWVWQRRKARRVMGGGKGRG